MKRNILLIAATALLALMANIKAEDVSFENLGSGVAAIKAGSSSIATPVPAPVASAAVPAAQREWLVLMFINGVNDLGILGFADKSVNEMEKVGSTDKVAVVTEFGVIGADAASRNIKFQRGSKTLFIQKDSDPVTITSPVIFTSNDTDMGSPSHLVRFVKRGIRQFPAKKVAVIIWNHGGGRVGISWDDASKNHMEVDQLGRAMAQIKQALGRKVDLFATDACLMQMAEVAYELKDSAVTIVGSEEVIPGDSYPYEAILAPLVANPSMSDEALGKDIVDAYGAHYPSDKVTLSALRASAMPGFLNLLNDWVQTVTSDRKAFKAAASQNTVDNTYYFQSGDSKDLYNYLENVNRLLPANSASVKAGAALKNYIAKDLLIRDTALPAVPKAHGLAIYIPDLRYDSANYEKFAFAADSLWDDFLKLMMEVRLKRP